LGINTGVRRGGILAIKKDHINLNTKSVFCAIKVKGVRKSYEIKQNHMFVVRNKGNKPYTVPLNATARRVMEELLADDELTGYLFLNEMTGRSLTEIKRSFKTACRLAGIEDFTFHDLRHTFATRLKEAGVDKISRRDLLGHSTTEMTDDYTHSYDETLQKAVDALPQRAKGD
jgi:integrase